MSTTGLFCKKIISSYELIITIEKIEIKSKVFDAWVCISR